MAANEAGACLIDYIDSSETEPKPKIETAISAITDT